MTDVWCEVQTDALAANLRVFRARVGPAVELCVAVKGNGYGHGAALCGAAFVAAGADRLAVHSLDDVRVLRAAGVQAPLQMVGPVAPADLAEAAALDVRFLVYDADTIARLAALPAAAQPLALHIKVETGNHRQGVDAPTAVALADQIAAAPTLVLEGVSSHFANIEDTTDHRYARVQLKAFNAALELLAAAGHRPPIRHLSNSAAALLWPDQVFEMVRVGVAAYGLWPSKETRVAMALTGQRDAQLHPALTWKTRVAQVKDVPEGAFVGYGCTYRAPHPTRIAILPVGYYDGYDRGLSNLAHVLIDGRRAPVRGRVCMNITMVDVTHIPSARAGSEVVLLGAQGDEAVTAEQIGEWAGTINYEVVTRIAEHVPRVGVGGSVAQPEDPAYRAPFND